MNPSTNQQVGEALRHLVESGTWGDYDGHACQTLVQLLAEEHHRTAAQLVCSGTIAVELALRGLGIAKGDLVMLAGYDFPGNFRAIEAVEAMPWLVDLPVYSWSLNLEVIQAAIQEQGVMPKAILVSHLHGTQADMSRLCAWASQQGVMILEDACQAHAALIDGQIAGSWGDISVLSFGGSKLITSGRGGAVLTNNPRYHQRMIVYRERGNDALAMSQLQACVIPTQWSSLRQQNLQRWQSVQYLEEQLMDSPMKLAVRNDSDSLPSFYKWGFQIPGMPNKSTERLRDSLVHWLREHAIPCGAGFAGFTKRSTQRCRRPASLPMSELAASRTVLIHHSQLLTDQANLTRLVELIWEWCRQSRLEL